MLRLSLALSRTPTELLGVLTASDLAMYQALVEIDGPWWGANETAMLRQICSLQAAAGGASIPPEDFAVEWRVGPADGPPANLLPPADGLAAFAAGRGLTVRREPA